MGLLTKVKRLGSLFGSRRGADPHCTADGLRICRHEEMESRRLMAADIHFGAVYYEDAGGDDSVGDTITVTFEGGAAGTQLNQLIIDGDKNGTGLSDGDIFFDTAPGGKGAFGSSPLELVSHNGFQVLSATVSDGGTRITFITSGWDAGEKLVFKIDVDEAQYVDPITQEVDTNALVEGAEFQRSKLTGTFVAPHFAEISGTAVFFDAFNENFATAAAAAGSTLNLPPDNYGGPNSMIDRTAGAVGRLTQVPLPITLSGTVFVDNNLTNTREVGEPGIAGVNLALYQLVDGVYVATGKTTVTDALGNYKFDALLPGSYRVVETQPANYFSVGAKAGTVNNVTNGTVTTVDIISDVTLLGGQDSVHNDFAEALPASLSGNVYHDRNNNGIREQGEEGIGGVTIQVIPIDVIGGSSLPITTTTAVDGSWFVVGLAPGKYRVVEIVQPVGYLDGLDAPGNAGGAAVNPGDQINGISLIGGQAGVEYNFGEILPNSISGRVKANPSGSCDDPNPILLKDVVIELLDSQGNVIATTLTDANGEYSFNGLPPGTYTVREIQPSAYFDGGDHIGSAGGVLLANDVIGQIKLVSGANGVRYDFCENLPLTLSGYVYRDDNNNGIFDTGEVPIAGVVLRLIDQQGNDTQTVVQTDANGFYIFTHLAPGTYGVREVQPVGYLDGLDTAGNRGGTAHNPGDLITGAVLTFGKHGEQYNFGELLPSSISGRVHADPEGDCTFGVNDIPLEGVLVHLLDQNGNIIRTTTTDANGMYKFDQLGPGIYGVREMQPAGYFQGGTKIGSAGGTVAGQDHMVGVNLGTGIDAVNYNFCENMAAKLSGFVYADDNNNGVFEANEQGIVGVTLELLDANGNPTGVTTVTTAGGFYQFLGLAPGVYGVREVQPAGYFDGLDTAGDKGGAALNPGDRITGATLKSNDHGQHYNFGELRPGSISGRVHADPEGDCVFGENDLPLAGVKVHLLDSQGNIIATKLTDANGRYKFDNLAPGTYGILEETPAGYFDSGDHIGSAGGVKVGNDHLGGITLTSGLDAVDYNFCEEIPVSISGFVYVDLNNNGIKEAGEAGIAGVKMILLDSNGVATGSVAYTDSNGFYRFDGLEAGIYGVAEVQPTAYLDGLDRAGSAGGVAINPGDRITGASLINAIAAVNYNFGELLPATLSGYVFQDGPPIVTADGVMPDDLTGIRNGVRKPGDIPIAGVIMRLGNAFGDPILDEFGNERIAITDANGYYQFTGLPPGVYTVLQLQPDGYYDGLETAGSTGGLVVNPNSPIDPAILSQFAMDLNNDAIIRIPLGVGQHSANNWFSEVLVTSPPPERPPLPPETPPPAPPEIIKAQYVPPAPVPPPLLLPPLLYGPIQELLRNTGDVVGYTWHLSVINGGIPRAPQEGEASPIQPAGLKFDALNWNDVDMNAGQWKMNTDDDSPLRETIFGMRDATPITGDFNGDGITDVGVYIEGQWFVDLNGNGKWDAGDLWAKLGSEQDRPVTGDWDGDGKDDIGIFGPAWAGDPRAIAKEPGLPHARNDYRGTAKNLPPDLSRATIGARSMQTTAQGKLRADLIDHVFHFGSAVDQPIVGDWTGHGTRTIGIYRDGQWYLDINGDGKWSEGDVQANYGQAGDKPVIGDFNGDGIDVIGVYRSGKWFIDSNRNYRIDAADRVFELGTAGDRPVVGDWDGSGKAQPGVFHEGALHRDTTVSK